jgi:branched-chain amino acid aminotransferase
MTHMDMEWPSFAGVPDDDLSLLSRPQSQELARWLWFDGEIRDAETTRIHYYANALHYGTAVFEGVRCYPTKHGTALFRLQDHIERLFRSAKLYGMQLPYEVSDLVRGAVEITARNGIEHGYLRPLAFFGRGPIEIKPKLECPVHTLLAIRSLGSFLGKSAMRNGIRLTVSSWRKIHHSMIPTMAKASGQYVNNVLAAHEAIDRNFDDAIMLNFDGTVASATGMNVFFRQGEQLVTNDAQSSIVPGMTRDCIITLARDARIDVAIRTFTREDLLRADEIFLTGTAAEVTPVRELEGVTYLTGKKTLGGFLQHEYLRLVTGGNEKYADWLTYIG